MHAQLLTLLRTPPAQMADSFEFDPLDVTKTWPEDRFPLQVTAPLVHALAHFVAHLFTIQ